MKKSLRIDILVVLLGAFCASPLCADDTLVKFKGGIGVHPVSNVTVAGTAVTVNQNIVRGVNPAGQLWVIDKLDAKVKTNGDINVEGKGLVLAGGNGIGRPPAQTNVFATLICGAVAPFTAHSSTGVPLEADGDFKIDDVLAPIPPTDCASPVLLIRNANGSAWFAAGIPD